MFFTLHDYPSDTSRAMFVYLSGFLTFCKNPSLLEYSLYYIHISMYKVTV